MTRNDLLAACLNVKREILRTNWYEYTAPEIQDKITNIFLARGYDSKMAKFAALSVMASIAEDYE